MCARRRGAFCRRTSPRSTSISTPTRERISCGCTPRWREPSSRSGLPPRRAELPERARVVIIGGGVGGAAIAYHLAARGERDVLLLERSELTSGSTFHSAGLVGQLRSSLPLTQMMMDSVELYRELDC